MNNKEESEELAPGEAAGCAAIGGSWVVMILLGVVLHVWTVVIAYKASGAVAAVLALIMPILAQIYWFFDVMSASGTIVNAYCLSVLAFFSLLGVFYLGAKVLIKLSEKFEGEDG